MKDMIMDWYVKTVILCSTTGLAQMSDMWSSS
jgi:hypothetical protein